MGDTHKYRKSVTKSRMGKLRFLPNNYAKTLQKRLFDKGIEYSVHTIRSVVQGVRVNTDILAEAVIYAEECRKLNSALRK